MSDHQEAVAMAWSDQDTDEDLQMPQAGGRSAQRAAVQYEAAEPASGLAAASDSSDGGQVDDNDDDSEDDVPPRAGAAAAAARARAVGGRHMPLPDRLYHVHPIMRLLAGHAHAERRVADSNEALVDHLQRSHVLHTPAVIAAMLACPRDAFVPEHQRDEDAFVDAPLAMEGMGFNMSAPHMHATCLEALQLQPGHSFLDVGCGSGILTACAAHMVGKMGRSVGIDTRRGAVKFCVAQAHKLERTSQNYVAAACPCEFSCHNVFIPSSAHLGRYDRVHVGACCREDKLQALLALLKPTGGLIVTPVAPSDLQAITVKPNGQREVQTLSQVRYSDLEVPSDLAVVMALLKEDRKKRTAVPVPPSTFSDDVAAIHGDVITSGSSSGSDQSAFHLAMGHDSGRSSDSMDGSGPRSPWQRLGFSKFLGACSSGGAEMAKAQGGTLAVEDHGGAESPQLRLEDLGEADCALVGSPSWRIPVHRWVATGWDTLRRAVLRARCDQFRALCNSGMRDADATEVHVPDDLPEEAVAAFKHWVYKDEIDSRMDATFAVHLLRVSNFFGAPHLVGLCDLQLSRELDLASNSGDLEGVCDSAAYLLALADDFNLAHLKAVALDFIVNHYTDVAASQGYAALTKQQTDLVAAEACSMLQHTRSVLKSVSSH